MPAAWDDLVDELRDRIGRAGLSSVEQVQVLADLLIAIGWGLACPDLTADRAALEAALTARGDLASALILQGQVLREWIAEAGGERPDSEAARP